MRYKELDALRGIAALFVVLFHFSMGREQLHLGFYLGITGVDLFFLISGFVIFMSISNVSKVSEFIVNRFTRLYPTYWTCVTITFISKLLMNNYANGNHVASLPQYLINLTMFQYHFNTASMDDSYWTLIIEMWFYILIGLLFTFKKMKYIIPIGLVSLGLLAISYLFPDIGYSIVFKKVCGFIPFINYLPLFLGGIIFYKIINCKENCFWYYIILVLCFAIKIIPADNGAFIHHNEYIWMLILYFSLFILFVNHKLNFLVSKATLFLGKISFALYLIHQFISTEVVLPYLINQCQINYWFAAFITLVIVGLIATGVTYLIEIPFGKRMNNYLRTALHLQKRL